MPKRLQPDIAYRVKKHMSNGYVYASTQPLVKDDKTGKMVRRHKSWGTVDENLRFMPNRNYMSAPQEERDKLIFPEDWDLSCIQNTLATGEERVDPFAVPVIASHNGKAFLYGGTWLLGQIVEKLSLKDSLMQAFWGDQEMVDDLLTIAMYTYINRGDWHNLCSLQQIEYYPSEHVLTEPLIKTLLDYLSEERFLWFMEQRLKSHEGKDLIVLESLLEEEDTRPYLSWETPVNLPRKAMLELVAYEPESFLPVWYQKTPVQLFGECLTQDVIGVSAPDQVQEGLYVFPKAFPSDYDLIHFLGRAQREGLRFLLPLSLSSRFAQNIGSDINHSGLESLSQENTYLGLRCRSYPISYEVEAEGQKKHPVDGLKTNLYYEWQNNDFSLDSYKNELRMERELVSSIRDQHLPVKDKKALERRLPLLDLTFQPCKLQEESSPKEEGPWEVVGYQMNQDVMANALKKESYFAVLSLGNDLEEAQTLDFFVKRKRQESLSRRLQEQMKYPTAPERENGEWGIKEIEDAGASFIRYLILLFDSYINHVLENTQLHQRFPNAKALMDEMRTLSYRKDSKDQLFLDTPTQEQQMIIRAFGFTFEPTKRAKETKAQGKRAKTGKG